MRQSSARFKEHKVKQPVEGPEHSNVAVPGVEVMSTELAMKVGSWCLQIFISALIARPVLSNGRGWGYSLSS